MVGELKALGRIAGGLVAGASKRPAIGSLLKRRGLRDLGRGAWMAFCGRDVASGLLLEGSPSDTYITSFVLPLFDKIEFVSWSLGRRLVHCDGSEPAAIEAERALTLFERELSEVTSTQNLVSCLDRNAIDGFYPIWVRYICLLREGRLAQADAYMTGDRADRLHASTVVRLEAISPSVRAGDADRVAKTLAEWEDASRRIFGTERVDLLRGLA